MTSALFIRPRRRQGASRASARKAGQETAGLGGLLEPGTRVLWVASCGGHLAELKKVADLYSSKGIRSTWVTFDTAQSRSMLHGSDVRYVTRVGTRDMKGTIKTLVAAYGILRRGSYDYVVSTGAAIAVSFLPLATLLGAESIYLESLTRTHGASTTGKILQKFSAVKTYTQYESWADSRWRYAGCVLDDCQVLPRQDRKIERVLVSLGTIHPYRFDRAVDAVMRALPEGCAPTWQLGATTRGDLPGVVHDEVAWSDMNRLIRETDVFVCHAGVGSVLQALDNGVVPVLAVRSASHGEHVDDHQQLFAQEMLRRGLGKVLEMADDGAALLQPVGMSAPKPAPAIVGTSSDPVPLRTFIARENPHHRLRGHKRQHTMSGRRTR